MRGECKYAYDGVRYKCVCGEWKDVKVTECWGEKEPSICDARRKEYCDRYKPIDKDDNKPKDIIDAKLSWIPTDEYDEQYGDTYKCARCGKEIIGTSNYCPYCGYEYKPWDGTTFK